jgi:hypothetical protein
MALSDRWRLGPNVVTVSVAATFTVLSLVMYRDGRVERAALCLLISVLFWGSFLTRRAGYAKTEVLLRILSIAAIGWFLVWSYTR